MAKRRGRPPKFGEPARAIVLTLPETVLGWLARIHRDPGWALVSVHEQLTSGESKRRLRTASPVIELGRLPGRRAIIFVKPQLFRRFPGVSVVPLPGGRGLLAFEAGCGLPDLELAVIDRLSRLRPGSPEARDLATVCDLLRRWRRTARLRFTSRALVVAERVPAGTATGNSRRPRPADRP